MDKKNKNISRGKWSKGEDQECIGERWKGSKSNGGTKESRNENTKK